MENLDTKNNLQNNLQNHLQNNLKEQILLKIRKGEVKMRPKAFFVAKVAVLIFVAFITFVVSAVLISYTWFNLRTGGQFFLLGFGSRGLYEFFLVFPWFLLLLDVGLILFLDSLLKRFKFGYHKPVLVVFMGSILMITVAGAVINMTSFHRNLMQMAENNKLPIPGVGFFYINLHKSHKENGLFRGQIISLATSSFLLSQGKEYGEVQVFTPDGFPVRVVLHEGDQVYVAGDVDGNIVRAYGVRKLSPNE